LSAYPALRIAAQVLERGGDPGPYAVTLAEVKFATTDESSLQ